MSDDPLSRAIEAAFEAGRAAEREAPGDYARAAEAIGDAGRAVRESLARIWEVVRSASCLAGLDCYDAETDAPDVWDAVSALTEDDWRLMGRKG